ncbi:MAG: hypothetical protein LBP33_10750 [Candidatus Adiutrix sp.]|jgi:hypothetical protein|nr:hypothetical protein [Candidatus Adiutrix sp.]
MQKTVATALLVMLLTAGRAAAIPPALPHYTVSPPLLTGGQIPAVLLVMSKDQKMFMQAYSDTMDVNGDGGLDIGFNPSIVYLGYFDSYSCYSYENSMFTRKSRAIPDGPSALPGVGNFPADHPAPRSAVGICNAGGGPRLWSGNWLNWVVTSRIDAVRKVLYGGKRAVSGSGNNINELSPAVLEPSSVQENSHVWGMELWSDSIWMTKSSSSPYYDLTKYTNLDKPAAGRGHFFARSRQLLHIAHNVNPVSSAGNPEGVRIWDWVTPESGAANPRNSSISAQAFSSYSARVEVCRPLSGKTPDDLDYLEEGDFCQQYQNAYKPVGLLQKYGEGDSALFGLFTGVVNNGNRWDGGYLRQNVKFIDDQINEDGTFVAGSMMKIIDKLQLIGSGDSWESPAQSNFGNPIGEMVYQALLYFAGESRAPTTNMFSESSPMSSTDKVDNWASPFNLSDTAKHSYSKVRECLQPVIMVISDVTPSHDADMLPGSPHQSPTHIGNIKGLSRTPYRGRSLPGDLTDAFNMEKYLAVVTGHEGYNKNGRKFYIANSNPGAGRATGNSGGSTQAVGAGDDNTCTAKPLSNLALARGICPTDPQTYGSYSLVAAAYYGNTHDLYDGRNVQTYAVAMASPFPDLTFKVYEDDSQGSLKGQISFAPIAIATSSPGGATISTTAASGTISTNAINTFIIHWKTDKRGQPYSGAVFVNFDDHLEGTGNYVDYDRDVGARYYFDLIRECRPGETCYGKNLSNAGTTGLTNLAEADAFKRGTLLYRGYEWVYKSWDNPKAPNYIKSTADPSFMETSVSSAQYTGGRPNGQRRYGEVIDIYGLIGPAGKYYKKIDHPDDVSEAVGLAMFLYTDGGTNNSYPAQVGYTMSGTTADGGYLEIISDTTYVADDINSSGSRPVAHKMNTPPTCPAAGLSSLTSIYSFQYATYSTSQEDSLGIRKLIGGQNVPYCGSPKLPLTATRLFKFGDDSAQAGENLPNPLWLAAKYGGFNDYDNDGRPGDAYGEVEHNVSEWDGDGDGNPDNYFYAANLTQLKDQLDKAFTRILGAMSTGTPTAATINSVLGGGLAIRTYYHSDYNKKSAVNSSLPAVGWVGGVYAFFIDAWGNLREDSNQDGILTLATNGNPRGTPYSPDLPELSGGDWIVEFHEGSEGPLITLKPDQFGEGLPEDHGSLPGQTLESVFSLWDLAANLAELNDAAVLTPRAYGRPAEEGRRIYYEKPAVQPLNTPPADRKSSLELFSADIISDADSPGKFKEYQKYLRVGNEEEGRRLVNYVMGQDQPGLRSRQVEAPWRGFGQSVKTWRLGDVINSTPVIVGPAFSNYDVTQRDASYSDYRIAQANRRHVAYFGSNDGMLHAVNLGFAVSLKQGSAGYQAEDPYFDPRHFKSPPNGAAAERVAHEMGAELWAFIPKSVLPHLKWLSDPEYDHSYYVDLKPVAVEVKRVSDQNGICSADGNVWSPGSWSPGGKWQPSVKKCSGDETRWRTLLISTLRLGGRSIELNDGSYSYSEVFALDITDPEREPELLWSFSDPQLGLPVAKPVAVRLQYHEDRNTPDDWFVFIPSGPTWDEPDGSTTAESSNAYSGYSNQSARIFVVKALTGERQSLANGEQYMDSGVPDSFFADSFGVATPRMGSYASYVYHTRWSNPMIYLSLTQSSAERSIASKFPAGPSGYEAASSYNDRGGIWRVQLVSGDDGQGLMPTQWQLAEFFNAGKAITGAIEATYDSDGRLWVYFGTGRMWSQADSTPCEILNGADYKLCNFNHLHYFYGIREKQGSLGLPTFEPAEPDKVEDVSNIVVYENGDLSNWTSGASDAAPAFTTLTGQTIGRYQDLSRYFTQSGAAGWKRALAGSLSQRLNVADLKSPASYPQSDWWRSTATQTGITHEMNLFKPAIMPVAGGGAYVSFTTYEPSSDICGGLGYSRPYLLDAFNGLPHPDFLTYGTSAAWEATGASDKIGPDGKRNRVVSTNLRKVLGMSSAIYLVSSSKGTKVSTNNRLDVDFINIPNEKSPVSGVISWREILDWSELLRR